MKTLTKIMLVAAILLGTQAVKAQEMEKTSANEIQKVLKDCGAFFLATTDGDQPRVRPFGALAVYNDKLYLITAKSKNVYKQIAANGKFELCGWNASKGEWIRVSGRLVTDDTIEAQEAVLDQNPDLKGMYKVGDSNTAVMYIEDGVATYNTFSGAPRTVNF